MQTKKTIAVIGTSGNMVAAIAKSLSKGNFSMLLYDNRPGKIQELVHAIVAAYPGADVQGMECSVAACWEADIIILAVPFKDEKKVAAKIKEVANQKIVISIANPINETYNVLETDPDTRSEELQMLLPYSKVVKAFNTALAADFLNPVIAGKQLDVFIAGNNNDALQTVAGLIKIAGFNPVITGDLPVSRIHENRNYFLSSLA